MGTDLDLNCSVWGEGLKPPHIFLPWGHHLLCRGNHKYWWASQKFFQWGKQQFPKNISACGNCAREGFSSHLMHTMVPMQSVSTACLRIQAWALNLQHTSHCQNLGRIQGRCRPTGESHSEFFWKLLGIGKEGLPGGPCKVRKVGHQFCKEK